jgi:hypothetical protein
VELTGKFRNNVEEKPLGYRRISRHHHFAGHAMFTCYSISAVPVCRTLDDTVFCCGLGFTAVPSVLLKCLTQLPKRRRAFPRRKIETSDTATIRDGGGDADDPTLPMTWTPVSVESALSHYSVWYGAMMDGCDFDNRAESRQKRM